MVSTPPVLPYPASPLAAAFAAPVVVTIADACALAQVACGAVREEEPVDLVSALASTGRSSPFAAPHILEELEEHLPRIAAKTGVEFGRAEHVLWGRMMPRVPVVDLAVRDHLSPASRMLLRDDPALPLVARGDADDAPTAALAEFLAPAVILTQDSVFTRFGLAVPVQQWVGMAHGLLRAAGFEASLTTAVLAAEVAAHLSVRLVSAVGRAAARNPFLATAVAAVAVLVLRRQGLLDRTRWKQGAVSLVDAAQPILERFTAALEDHALTRGRLVVVETAGPATVEQRAARYLARADGPLSAAELRGALAGGGERIPATRLRAAMLEHPAFTRLSGDRFALGRPARRHLRSGGPAEESRSS
ncbi:hypothetical protein ACFC26_30995 [Kitasatospora purpeofusca]|uniref:hypothetical protein n=1 Tax=Kitasatospora purpeofusca TaxID=67352 RepID=UPI0035DEFAEA